MLYDKTQSNLVTSTVAPEEAFIKSVVNQVVADYGEIDGAAIVAGIRKEFADRMNYQISELDAEIQQSSERISRRHEAIKRTIGQL